MIGQIESIPLIAFAVPVVLVVVGGGVAALVLRSAQPAEGEPRSRGSVAAVCGFLALCIVLVGLVVFGLATLSYQRMSVKQDVLLLPPASMNLADNDWGDTAEAGVPWSTAPGDVAMNYGLDWITAFAVVAVIGSLFVVRMAGTWAAWEKLWKPVGAITAAVVMTLAGGVLTWTWPVPQHADRHLEAPQFVEFLESRFGHGSGNGGYKDLVVMASDPELDEHAARLSESQLIGGLPYGRPLESNETYSEKYVFTAGGVNVADDGVWAPLLGRDEVFQVSEVSLDGDELVFEFGEVPVSHQVDEGVPDGALVSLGEPKSVVLSAIASGRFTTVEEAWDDLLGRLRKRVGEQLNENSGDLHRAAVIRGLNRAVTRLAVTRQPLILGESEDETVRLTSDSQLVQPMYRVHVAIAESRWNDALDSIVGVSDGPRRDRAMIVIAGLAFATLLIGGVGYQTAERRA